MKIAERLDRIQRDVHKIDIRLARMETALSIKSGIIGFIAGCIPPIIMAMLFTG